jgi:Undecaprenyl-phosphate glucose phosphotransferase
VIESRKIDMVIIALPLDATDRLEAVLRNVSDGMVDIKVVPDLYQFVTLKGGVEEFDGLPIISLQDTPYYGWNLAAKRAIDVVVSCLALVFLSPAFLIFALLIKLGSRGPVFYRQERMGLDGIIFTMLKFRTMIEKAEASGPKWAEAGDPRRTAIGRLLRKTSLDELPQFINSLRGEMSVVGPRPERPVFIEDFRKKVPKYMLRHRMKAGITGWAQVNGLRGNTSLSNRIEYDIYYIQNWSISFDIKIMLLTVFRMMRDKNAY